MPHLKANKIDQCTVYPCPCRKQGELCPITLTDALGCNRCNNIFVVRSDGYTLEQLSGAHPYKQLWYWTGHQWQPIRPAFYHQGCTWVAGILSLLFVILLCLPFILKIPIDRHVMVWMVLTICIATILSFMVWLAAQRRF